MADFVKGDLVILSIWDGVDSYDPIACLTSVSLSQTKNMIESQTKCDPGTIVRTPGSKDYEISFDAELSTTGGATFDYNDLRADFEAGTSKDWKIANITTGVDYYGLGYFSELSLEAPAGDEIVTFSGTIVSDGVTDISTTALKP